MTDRELLELAAKAAAYKGEWVQDFGSGDYYYQGNQDGILLYFGDGCQCVWNPLTDDGDALRLAVKLRFYIKDFSPNEALTADRGMVEIWQEHHDDPIHVEWYSSGADRCFVTRRAIVRAAAEIGKSL